MLKNASATLIINSGIIFEIYDGNPDMDSIGTGNSGICLFLINRKTQDKKIKKHNKAQEFALFICLAGVF